MRKYPEALADANTVIGFASESDVYIDRGSVYLDMNDLNQSLDDFNQAVKIHQDYALAFLDRGIAYSRLGRRQEAIADFKKVLELPTATDNWKEMAQRNLALSNK